MKYKRIPFNYDWEELISQLIDDEEGDGVSLDLDNDILHLKNMKEIPWCEFPDDTPMKKTGMWVKDEGDGFVGYYIVYNSEKIYYTNWMESYDELINESENDEDYLLTLSTRNGRPLIEYTFREIEEDEVPNIKYLIDNENINELWEHLINQDEYGVTIVFNTYDDKDDFLDYDLVDSEGKEIDTGQFQVLYKNIVYRKKNNYCIINQNYHPNYLLIVYDTLHKGQTTFEVPKTIDVHKLKFDDSTPVDYRILEWDWFGDRTTNIFTFRYDNKRYNEIDYLDNGSLGEYHFGLFKWDGQRYILISEC